MCCKITDGLNTDFHLDIGNGVSLEKVDKFCYLGDILDADGGCDSAVTATAWKKFHEYLTILTGKGFLLKLKGKVKELDRGRPKKTWWVSVKNDVESLGLSQRDAQFRN